MQHKTDTYGITWCNSAFYKNSVGFAIIYDFIISLFTCRRANSGEFHRRRLSTPEYALSDITLQFHWHPPATAGISWNPRKEWGPSSAISQRGNWVVCRTSIIPAFFVAVTILYFVTERLTQKSLIPWITSRVYRVYPESTVLEIKCFEKFLDAHFELALRNRDSNTISLANFVYKSSIINGNLIQLLFTRFHSVRHVNVLGVHS